jgi:hypothetical protein
MGKGSIVTWRKMEGDDHGIFLVECLCHLHRDGITQGGKGAMKARSLVGRKSNGQTIRQDFKDEADG